MTERRDDLLRRVVKAAAAGGLARRSLRDLATRVGTSHRMLIHHFGSRDGLVAAVVEAVERDQNERLGELPNDAAEAIRVSWRRTSVPSLWPIERLFFECYARGAQGEPPFDRLVPALVEQTLAAVSARADVAADEEGRAGARLGLAVIRGLLLDLVATGDRRATDRALELYASLVADRSAARQSTSPRRTTKKRRSPRARSR
ncbi:MAG TPA: TetR family transcriptional regulator [Vicinamibacterales bacterium]|jgi:AcrR family transcriptional regulator|nr:TetR family transcriptional regulator [Vicinamibacterales bacterium]